MAVTVGSSNSSIFIKRCLFRCSFQLESNSSPVLPLSCEYYLYLFIQYMCVHVEGGREDNQSLLVVVKFDRYKDEEIRDEKKINI